MTSSTQGLHHITAICGDPAENRQFFVDVLGLRLVKKTVNFDDPGTYHLYYGDELLGRRLSSLYREASASPATGSAASHRMTQARLVEQALTL